MVRALLEGARGQADDVGRLLAEINREVLAILGQASVPVFLSAFYAVVDVTSGQLRYANAGHPGPLLVRRREGVVESLSPDGYTPGPPLGVRDQASYAVSSASLAAGDLLVLFTDGLFEASGPDHEPYGEERLRLAVERRLHLPTGRLFDELLTEVQQFTQGRGFADDLCLVGMELA
jgi:serine phosphatase RsbU (regulator of sigma subunit)